MTTAAATKVAHDAACLEPEIPQDLAEVCDPRRMALLVYDASSATTALP